jgi:tRNA 2-thiouridine synthesizing protein E
MQCTKDNFMTQFVSNAQDSETFSLYAGTRREELNAQDWSQEKSARLAEDEGISLNNEHWAVIAYLRARALNRQFSAQGGSKYLYGLFAGGPVTQGSRLANLRTPATATDVSFGTSY